MPLLSSARADARDSWVCRLPFAPFIYWTQHRAWLNDFSTVRSALTHFSRYAYFLLLLAGGIGTERSATCRENGRKDRAEQTDLRWFAEQRMYQKGVCRQQYLHLTLRAGVAMHTLHMVAYRDWDPPPPPPPPAQTGMPNRGRVTPDKLYHTQAGTIGHRQRCQTGWDQADTPLFISSYHLAGLGTSSH